MRTFITILFVSVLLTASLGKCYSQSYPIIRIDDNNYYTTFRDSSGCAYVVDFDNPIFKVVICWDKYYPCDFINDTTYVKFDLLADISLNHTTLSDSIIIKNIKVTGFISNDKEIFRSYGDKSIEGCNLFVEYFKSLLCNIDLCYSTLNNMEIKDSSLSISPFYIWVTFVPVLSH